MTECKIGSKWYIFNDEIVSPTESPDTKSSTVYVLFYKQEDGNMEIEEEVENNEIRQ